MGRLVKKSLGYSTLQAGSEFPRWLVGREPARHDQRDTVVMDRVDGHHEVAFDRRSTLAKVLQLLLRNVGDMRAIALVSSDDRSLPVVGGLPAK